MSYYRRRELEGQIAKLERRKQQIEDHAVVNRNEYRSVVTQRAHDKAIESIETELGLLRAKKNNLEYDLPEDHGIEGLANLWASSDPPLPLPPSSLKNERFVTLERAKELSEFAWRNVKFTSGAHGNGRPNLVGNCVGKSRWLQQHLGGILICGVRTDRENAGRHAALLFANAGKLYVADYGEIMPAAEYPFYVEGFDP